MLFISNLRPLRLALSYPRALLASLTRIEPDRLRDIETRKAEPWFDEVLALGKVLNLPTALDLFSSGDLTQFELDPRFFERDLEYWRLGVRLPVSLAMRLAHRFGVTIDDLDPSMLTRQVWSVLAASERHPEAPGWCPWCQADIVGGQAHEDHCLPHHLYGSRDPRGQEGELVTGTSPRPGKAGRLAGSATAHGLKDVRQGLGKTQVEMAKLLDWNSNHYARVERGELPLVLDKANELAMILGIERDLLFASAQ